MVINIMVVILNGPSCSGKSTIAKEICKLSDDKFVHLQVDEAKNYLSTILDQKSTLRHIGRQICDDILLQTADIFLKNGKNVVIDTIFNGDDAVLIAKKHLDFFQNQKVLFAGIECALTERLKRFKVQNDNPRRNEKAIIEHEGVFELCKSLYSEVFDTIKMSANDIAKQILAKIGVSLSFN
ncbi:phosphotransferase-like protein [Candidatus Deianiraea vastatrix]|nr:AAA family ATPase [Candidatus Deianiraea vastatrix]